MITSSIGDHLSLEDPAWQHGAFTHVLLRAFDDPTADINHDHTINGNGLANYLSREMPKLNDQQTPEMEIRSNATVFVTAQ